MTEKSDMGADVSAPEYAEIYDPSQNKEDWSFSDVDGNAASMAETSDIHKSIFVAAGGKTIELYHEKFGTLWAARFVEGGTLPQELKGRWTDPNDAKLEADLYVARLNAE